MKHLYRVLLISVAVISQAQTYDEVIYENPTLFLLYENENILITTNGNDVIFAGFLGFRSDSQGSVTIKPETQQIITIKAIPHNSLNPSGAGTQVGGRPPLGGGGGIQPKTTLSPNPATNIIQLQSTENIVEYKIYDAQGTVKSENKLLKSKQFSANINTLLPGIYYMTVLLENGQTISKQFIKQ